MRVRQHFCEKDPESLEDRFGNFVPAAEPVPFNYEPRLAQCVTKPLRSDIGQDLILHSVALEDWEAFAFRHERAPFLCGEQIPGELHQSRVGAIRVEHRIARQHGALGKSSEHRFARICAECAFDFFEECQHGLAHGSETFGNLVREIAGPPCRLILGHARHVDEPPGPRVPWPKTQRERSFGKDKPCAGRHVQDVGQRHEIVPRRTEAVQEHHERAVAPAFPICATGKAKSETSELSYAHIISRSVTGLAQVQVLEEGQQSVKRRFDDWLPPYGNKGSLAHRLDVLDDLTGQFDVGIAC